MNIKKLLKELEQKRELGNEDILLLANALYDTAEKLGYGLEADNSGMQSVTIYFFPGSEKGFEVGNLCARAGAWKVRGERENV